MSLSLTQQEGEVHNFEDGMCSSSNSIKTPAQGFWSELPEDVIVEILCRLSQKDLFALKSVSKDWNFVISGLCIPRLCPPYASALSWGLLAFQNPPPPSEGGDDPSNKFLKLEFLTVRSTSLPEDGVKCQRRIPDSILSLLPSPERDPSHVLDCCNGLILLTSNSQYYVGNPITRQRFPVPINPNTRHQTKSIHSSLVFDPSLFFNNDPSLPLNFKILSCIRPAVYSSVTHPMELDIFCSETREWSSHVLPLEPHNLYGFEWLRRSVYFNGALYSLSLAMYLVCIDNILNSSSSISMDCSDLKAWAIELPDKDQIPTELLPHFCGGIGNSTGCFYYSNRNVESSSILVWMLVGKGTNSKWLLIHSISITHDIVSHLYGGRVQYWKKFDCFRPRGFLPHDDAIVIAAPKLVISYYLKTKEVKEGYIPLPLLTKRHSIQLDGNWIFPFSPCLLLLNGAAQENLRE